MTKRHKSLHLFNVCPNYIDKMSPQDPPPPLLLPLAPWSQRHL